MYIDCPRCTSSHEAEMLCDYTVEKPDDWFDAYKYTLLKCPKCSGPLLIVQEREININTEPINVFWGRWSLLYPSISFHVNPVIPESLQSSLEEAIQCYKAKAYTATTIMCRRIIEGFCTIKGIEEFNLAKSIEKLRSEKIINEQLYEWANELRLVGNEAAHNIELVFSALDAKDALDFTIAILDFTYSFKDKFEKFKNRGNRSPE